MKRSLVLVVLVPALLSLLAAGAASARGRRYSGTVAAVDPQRRVLVVEEVGPWRIERGGTVLTRRTIALTPETKYNLFMRVDVPGAYTGDFIEVQLDRDDVSTGDFVTVQCVNRDGRLVANTVTVAEAPEP